MSEMSKSHVTLSFFSVEKNAHVYAHCGPHLGVDPTQRNCVGSRSCELQKNLDKTTETELICHPPLTLYVFIKNAHSISMNACELIIEMNLTNQHIQIQC